jgi:hypothetical protein
MDHRCRWWNNAAHQHTFLALYSSDGNMVFTFVIIWLLSNGSVCLIIQSTNLVLSGYKLYFNLNSKHKRILKACSRTLSHVKDFKGSKLLYSKPFFCGLFICYIKYLWSTISLVSWTYPFLFYPILTYSSPSLAYNKIHL